MRTSLILSWLRVRQFEVYFSANVFVQTLMILVEKNWMTQRVLDGSIASHTGL